MTVKGQVPSDREPQDFESLRHASHISSQLHLSSGASEQELSQTRKVPIGLLFPLESITYRCQGSQGHVHGNKSAKENSFPSIPVRE